MRGVPQIPEGAGTGGHSVGLSEPAKPISGMSWAMKYSKTRDGFRRNRSNTAVRVNGDKILLVATVLWFIIGPTAILANPEGNTGLRGLVTDSVTGQPLVAANVIPRETSRGATTDSSGRFTITNLRAGRYRLSVSYIGFARTDTLVHVHPGTTLHLRLSLTPESLSGNRVVVTANRTAFDRKTAPSRMELSPRELKTAPALGEADLFRTLQLLPGVASQNDFSSALAVRGGSPDENLILLDGVEIYNPYHFGGIFSAFNTAAIRDVQMQSGGFPVEYGGRLSSVLAISTRDGDSGENLLGPWWQHSRFFDINRAALDLSLLSTRGVMEGPVYRGGYAVAGRRTYFDQLSGLVSDRYSDIPELPYFFSDLQWKVWSQITSSHRVTIAGYSGTDDLSLALGGNGGLSYAVDFDWEWGNRANSIALTSIIMPTVVMKSRLSESRYTVDANLLTTDTNPTAQEGSNRFILTNHLKDRTVSTEMHWLPGRHHQIQLGLEYKRFNLDYAFTGNEMAIMSERRAPTLMSLYLQEQWSPSPLWRFHLGIRPNRYSLGSRIWTDIRGGFRYHLRHNLRLKGAAGSYTQFLFTTNQEDGILRIVDFWNAVPEYLAPQRAEHYILGLEYQANTQTSIRLETYYKLYTNLITLNPLQHLSDPDDNFMSGTGRASGLEVLLKRTGGPLTGWVAYTYARTLRMVDYDRNGHLEQSAGEIYPPRHDRRHTLHLMVHYRFAQRHSIGLTWTWTSGQPYTPLSGKRFGGVGTAGWYQSYSIRSGLQGPRNSATMPQYLRGDISYSKGFRLGQLTGKLQLQVINFTNHFNVLLYQWDHSGESSKVVATSMFPIIPTLGVSFEL